ncbi:ZINC FINGER/BTB DOMAIN PROTEIN [Salix koriyanagi]|uniref:ZINC FINGER/BTB DOMAIN PROTEIN n=1 Tax=Salix koriyanagi TaxID=2511006 RepID=A0A9Q0WAR0_9ROSI|nr:ZINC FINGER/BTB DOMAIN PROTEIN [Salix koriyanagi]
MTKAKKELLSKAPWRGEDDDESNKFKDAKLKVTSQPGSTPTMHVPRKKNQRFDDEDDDDQALEIDPELRYSFQRNFQFIQRVFSIDTVDPEGIANAQKSLGLGQEENTRRVR